MITLDILYDHSAYAKGQDNWIGTMPNPLPLIEKLNRKYGYELPRYIPWR